MDAYTLYARWRVSRRVGLGNRRLAGMLGDFVYETSSAEDESRRILEALYEAGMNILLGKDLQDLNSFTSEHNRDKRRAEGEEEKHVSWGRIDALSQEIIRVLSLKHDQSDVEFVENLAALNRMFSTTRALRSFRNKVDHRAPSDGGVSLHFYRDDSPVSARTIWGWTEVAASYWTNLTAIGSAISNVTGVRIVTSLATPYSRTLQWPPTRMSVHALRVLQQSGIAIPAQQSKDARDEWTNLVRRWNR